MSEQSRLYELIGAAAALTTAATNALRYGYDTVGPLGQRDHRESYRGELEQRMAAVRAVMIQCCEAGDTDKAAVHSRADKLLGRRAVGKDSAP